MDFSSDANANFEGLLAVNREICMPQMAEKTSADAPPSCAVVPKFFGGLCALAAGRRCGRAHLARQSIVVGKTCLGARLRTRKVAGRDTLLPAPLLAAFLVLVSRPAVGALPQTPQGTLSLDPARGRRKGTKSPLDPFVRLRWSHSLNSSACGFFILPPPMLLMFAASPANPHSPSQSAHSGRAASSLPPPAIHTASAPRRRAGRCWSRSFHPADALR